MELNSVNDNPLVFGELGETVSAGLFHAQPVALAADYLKIAVAEIASLSERRLYRLTTGSLSSRLPPALSGADRPSLGMLVPQAAAAALDRDDWMDAARANARFLLTEMRDADGRPVQLVEKPADPPTMPGKPDTTLASMGIYVFNKDFLFEQLVRDERVRALAAQLRAVRPFV